LRLASGLQTNELDLRLKFPEWNPKEHFLVNVLLWVKKIFYLTSFDEYSNVPNSAAKELFDTNKEEYIRLVRQCVDESVTRRYENPEGFAFRVSEVRTLSVVRATARDSDHHALVVSYLQPQPAHDELLKRILRDTNPNLFSSPVRERSILEEKVA